MSSKAQRRAKYIAKQEKLKLGRDQQKQPATAPTATIDAAKEPQGPVANSDTEQREGKSKKCPPATRAECALAWFTGILMFFAIVQGIAMVVQNNIMREQMGQTDKILDLMQLEQRPWLVAYKYEPIQLAKDKKVLCTVTVKNTGRQPGTIDRATIDLKLINTDSDIDKMMKAAAGAPSKRPTFTSVAPEATIILDMEDGPIIGEAAMSQINSGEAKLCFGGVFTYRYADGKHGITMFCEIWDAKTNASAAIPHAM